MNTILEDGDRARRDTLAVYLATSLGLNTYYRLISWYGSASAARSASLSSLEQVPGLSTQQVNKVYDTLHSQLVNAELENLERNGIKLIIPDDTQYPQRLKQIHQPPPVLYYRGCFQDKDRNALAIVGTRRSSSYGLSVAAKLGYELAERGLTIVSGMARGIDQSAHMAALDAGGRTIAVLGSGLLNIYPPKCDQFSERIAQHGLVISEFPLNQPPYKGNFPRRNRIIAGLCLGVLVVEAPERSGALITAHYALEQGREVFAIPGRITSFSAQGCNRLIQMGAKLVTRIEDIIEEIDRQLDHELLITQTESSGGILKLDPVQQLIYSLLSDEPKHIDLIQRQSGLSASQLAPVLLKLELDGLLKQLPGKMYLKCYLM
ncbi:DNA-processing protein DprA [bacterium]|nr:DNA-processing protein DprA [bacterium]